jgi:hypothetical protein
VEAAVTELYGDFRLGRRPAAVMAIQFTLVDLTGISPRVRLEQTIASSIALAESSPEALVDGHGAAPGEILEICLSGCLRNTLWVVHWRCYPMPQQIAHVRNTL